MMGSSHRLGSVALTLSLIAASAATASIVSEDVKNIIWLPESKNLMYGCTFVAAGMFGGLLPDADTPMSEAGHKMIFVLWPAYLIRGLIVFLGKFIKPFHNIGRVLAHRGIFHAPIFWTLIFTILSALTYRGNELLRCVLSGMYLGIISHLFLDYIAGGIPLFAPFSMKRYKPFIVIKTGGLIEVIVRVMLGIISLYMLYLIFR